MLLFTVAMIGSAGLVVAPVMNDVAIMDNPGRGMATVTGVSPIRTAVDYQDEQGRYHSPPQGLLYPTGLGVGQQVWVTYSKDNPDLVKVEGRTWRLALKPAASVAVVSVLLAGLAWWGTSRARSKGKNSPVVPHGETTN